MSTITKHLAESQKIKRDLHEILEVRHLTDSAFVMRIERKGLTFTAGQHVCVGPPNGIHTREYSVYSSEQDEAIEILVKEVTNGLVTPVLKKLKLGMSVVVEEAVGYFTLPQELQPNARLLFIASGTGISPFHSFVHTHPGLRYQLLHGVKYAGEAYERSHYANPNYVLCTSRDDSGDFRGRVTDYLEVHPVDPQNLQVFLCGNCNMIHEVYDILEKQGVPTEQIHAEVYF